MSSPASILRPIAEPAIAQATIAWVLIAGAASIFLIVVGLIAWILYASRAEQRSSGPAGVAARTWIYIGGLCVPTLVLLAVFLYAVITPVRVSPARDSDALIVSVVGHMWWWEVRYRDPLSAREIALANEIHLPIGRPALLGLESADVIHSFWVPALGGKVDMIPGSVQQLRVVPARAGILRGVCAEFCGEQHARMALTVVVHEAADFDNWLRAQAAPAVPPMSASGRSGERLFATHGCAVCHSVRGTFEQANAAAPDLTHVASRHTLGAGILAADRKGFADWLVNVQRLKSGARMPSYERLDPASLEALVSYLEALR